VTHRDHPEDLRLALVVLRALRVWTQAQMAAEAGLAPSVLSEYERGQRKPSRRAVERAARAVKVRPEALDRLLSALRSLRESMEVGAPASSRDAAVDEISRAMEALVRVAGELAFRESAPEREPAPAPEDRAAAPDLWKRLQRYTPTEQRLLIEEGAEFKSWALCELLCSESEEAARDSADRALELAQLALRIAELAPGRRAWGCRIQGYAWAHLGNARRVSSDLLGADEAFRRSERLWRAGAIGDLGPLDEARLLDLKASLRRAQGRFGEARELLDRALTVDRGGRAGRILLKKATVLEALGEIEEAIATLHQAAPWVEAENSPQLLFALRFNLAVNLCFLERPSEAESLLPGLWELAKELGQGLDLVRLRWLEGRVAAGLGRREEARVALEETLGEFTQREIAYDAALVSLELAVLSLEEGRTGEVKKLAREMAWIFQAQGVHREALAALRLFQEAAEQEAVTVEMARRLTAYLHRAQNDPSLQFEAGGS
jgi:transcriptional regulator with XRE-family HTH domain